MDRKKSKITLVLIITVLIISLGYAALSTVFKINSTIGIGKIDFNIIFDNVVEVATTATVVESAHISDDKNKEISFNVNFTELDQYYTFTTDIKNEGTIPGKIKTIDITGISDSMKKLIEYDITYTSSGKKVKIGDHIKGNTTKNITIKVYSSLSDDVTNQDLPAEGTVITPTLTINYEHAKTSDIEGGAIAKMINGVHFMPTANIDFTKQATSDDPEGIYRLDGTENDAYPIYFYRGGHENVNNHVIFGNYCWRIVRTTNTGGIKLLYNGVPTNDTCTSGYENQTYLALHKYGDSYRYYESEGQRFLNTFYFENLIQYEDLLEDTPFCNGTAFTNGNISTECNENDVVSVANGKNTYPIGLMTAQEYNMCGMSLNQSNAIYPWPYSGNHYEFTMTGNASAGASYYVWVIYEDGRMIGTYGAFSNYAIRPVITLNSEASFYDGGDGSSTNPYIVITE